MAARILICDNEETLRALVRACFVGSDYDIAEARDGPESLDLARRLRPDVILLDMMMPGLSGLEVLAALKDHPDTADIPVVMLTARTQAADRAAAEAAGASRFLPKPFSPSELVSTVEELRAQA